jgi:hypothetical protein
VDPPPHESEALLADLEPALRSLPAAAVAPPSFSAAEFRRFMWPGSGGKAGNGRVSGAAEPPHRPDVGADSST